MPQRLELCAKQHQGITLQSASVQPLTGSPRGLEQRAGCPVNWQSVIRSRISGKRRSKLSHQHADLIWRWQRTLWSAGVLIRSTFSVRCVIPSLSDCSIRFPHFVVSSLPHSTPFFPKSTPPSSEGGVCLLQNDAVSEKQIRRASSLSSTANGKGLRALFLEKPIDTIGKMC